jgi:uncharacterized protein YcfL
MMLMNRSAVGVLVLVVLLLLALQACMYKSTDVTRTPMELKHEVTYKELALKAQVGVYETSQTYVNGLLEARVKFKNMVNWVVNCEVKVKWLDDTGFEIKDITGWEPLTLPDGEVYYFKALAPSPEARSFSIIIQTAGG